MIPIAARFASPDALCLPTWGYNLIHDRRRTSFHRDGTAEVNFSGERGLTPGRFVSGQPG